MLGADSNYYFYNALIA